MEQPERKSLNKIFERKATFFSTTFAHLQVCKITIFQQVTGLMVVYCQAPAPAELSIALLPNYPAIWPTGIVSFCTSRLPRKHQFCMEALFKPTRLTC